MFIGISDDLRSILDLRKTAVINNEPTRFEVGIVALKETRLPETGTLREKGFTFYWHCKTVNEKREHEVWFAVKNSLLKTIEPPTIGSERILTMTLNTVSCPVTLISVYGSTFMASPDTRDEFHEELCATLRTISFIDQVILLGDFNTRNGCDSEGWSSCLRKFNVGKVKEKGQRLLEFYTCFNLCVAESFFSDETSTHDIMETSAEPQLSSA